MKAPITAIVALFICVGHTDYAQNDTLMVNAYYYSHIGPTASGIKTTKIKEPFIAISRDLLATYPMGSYLILSDCLWAGTYKVMDVMSKRYTLTVDVFAKPKKRHNKQKCKCSSSQTPSQ
jgi:3D (Asp-Asp-Asp) domain-containing protein